MKVAVINFSGNVGKTTVARHLLAPRIAGAKVIATPHRARARSASGRQVSFRARWAEARSRP